MICLSIDISTVEYLVPLSHCVELKKENSFGSGAFAAAVAAAPASADDVDAPPPTPHCWFSGRYWGDVKFLPFDPESVS